MNGTRRLITVCLATGLLVLATATPALGAKPIKEVIDLADSQIDALIAAALTDACGVPIGVETSGRLTIHYWENEDGSLMREIQKWFIRQLNTNLETGESYLIKDVGPDIFWIGRDGHLYVAVTGRALTGTGVIGRTVIDIDTGELILMAGQDHGTLADQVCPALT